MPEPWRGSKAQGLSERGQRGKRAEWARGEKGFPGRRPSAKSVGGLFRIVRPCSFGPAICISLTKAPPMGTDSLERACQGKNGDLALFRLVAFISFASSEWVGDAAFFWISPVGKECEYASHAAGKTMLDKCFPLSQVGTKVTAKAALTPRPNTFESQLIVCTGIFNCPPSQKKYKSTEKLFLGYDTKNVPFQFLEY